MIFNITVDELGGLTFPAWTFGDEKQVMLLKGGMTNDDCIEQTFNILVPSLSDKKLSKADKQLLLINGRMNLVGDIIDVRFNCVHCGRPTEGQYSIGDSIRYEKASDNKFVVNNHTFVCSTIEDNSNILERIIEMDGSTEAIVERIDALSMDEVSLIIKALKDVKSGSFYLECNARCMLCGEINSSIVDEDTKFINTVIEYDSVKSFYETELDLKKSANFSLKEIHNLLPFEVAVYIGIINSRASE